MVPNNNHSPVLHKIRVKLYPNYLPNSKGTYIARTNSEQTLSVEDVCAALKARGGYDGDYNQLVDTVCKYLGEVAYQLCDGFSVNNGYYSLWANVGGTFDSANEQHDHRKHPIGVRFGIRSKLDRALNSIRIDTEGLANVNGYIDTFTDTEKNSVNGLYLPGNVFAIHGSKIKIEGTDPDVGLYFVPGDGNGMAVKVERIVRNNPSEIMGIAPNTGCKNNKLELRTQFSASKHPLLKNVRTITSIFTLEEGDPTL